MIRTSLIHSITQNRFCKNEQGAVLPMVGLSFIIMMLSAGFAIDYTRAQIVRERLQWAVDAAALAGAKVAPGGKLSAVQAEANAYFRANFPVGYMETRSGTPKAEWIGTENGKGSGVRFSMDKVIMENYVVDTFGVDDMKISAVAEVNTLPIKPLDVVFSVDVSGSMQVVAGKSCTYLPYGPNCYKGGPSKLTDAKNAMNRLVDQLHSGNDVRFGMVPWSSIVNIYSAIGGNHPYVTCDGGNRLSALASDNPSLVGWGNAGAPYMETPCSEFSPGTIKGSGSMRAMRYFTNDKATIKGVIGGLKAEANTDGPLGILWAYKMYQKNQGWIGWKTPAANKAIVILTDGDNTKYYPTPGEGDASQYGVSANNAQLSICTQAKNAGITIYTIAYDMDNRIPSRVRGKKMLESCASKSCPTNPNGTCYFDARRASDLNNAMTTIGNTMMTMRLTK